MKKLLLAFFAVLFVGTTLVSAGEHSHQPKLTPQPSGTTQGLIAVSPVNSRVVWASGRGGTFVVTTDGGRHWRSGVVPGAEALQFRDVEGISERVAYLMSIGDNPGDFRIYKTLNGGRDWTMQFQNANPSAFYDCFAFWTPWRGIAHSDSVDGQFPDLRTRDGMHWKSISENMPAAQPGEASFASSGTCVTTEGERNAWIATGGAAKARILATRDGGRRWNAYDTPLVSSPSAGAFTVAFRDAWHGIVGGGDLDPADANNAATAISDDGGRSWRLTNAPPVTGAIFGLSYANSERGRHRAEPRHGRGHDRFERTVVITANDGGAAWTPDEGENWFSLSGVSGYWGVAFADPDAGWLVGTDGRILKIKF